MKVEFSFAGMASIIGYRSSFTNKVHTIPLAGKISSVRNVGNICFSKATGKKMLPEPGLAEHDKNKKITRNAARRIENYLQSTHNPANENRVRFDL
ncbi:hypothetical protein [Erwinia tasmaniensis]|uniref:hypothetical protein n=1 Tax=Erwinia tasmaniensis TaxID=338565 RepID=UPI003A4DA1A4